MKNLKKVLALVVALTMVFTTVAFASVYPDVDADANYAGAVELLSALEILKGDDNGNFNPGNTITRAEFAAVVCRALGLEGSANGAKGATMFTDVAADHWASGYINLASQQGIVNGKGNGIFDPEGNVTFTEAVKMLVVALGYEPMASQRGGWPTGYLTVANSTKMTAGVSASGTDAAALRSTVAQLTANAIEIPVMDQTSFGTETKYEPMDDYGNYKTLLTSRDVYIVTGVVTDLNEVDGEFDFKFSAYPDDFEFGYNTNGYAITNFIGTSMTFDVAASNVIDFIGQSVDVYLSKVNKADYEAIIAVPSGIGETLMISVEDLAGATTIATTDKVIEYYETKDANKATKIYVAPNPTVKVNGQVVNKGGKDASGNDNTLNITNLDAYKTQVATLTFTENTNDKYFDIIDVTVYEYGIVEDVFADKERIEFLDGNKVGFDFDNDEQIVAIYNAEGAEIALEDIVAGDVLAMVVGDALTTSYGAKKAKVFDDKITIYNLGQSSVTGTVTGHSSDDKELVIDGATYEYMAGNWVADTASTFIADCLGAEGIFYLGLDGKIIGFDGSSVVSGNYGFIANATLNTNGFAPHYQVKLLTADAGIVTFDVDTECEINGTEKKVVAGSPITDEQAAFLALGEYVNSTGKATANARLIKYDTNKNGEIDEIDFVGTGDTINGDCSISSSSVKVDSKKLDANVVIFDVSAADVEDAKVVAIDTLIDEVAYEGFTFDVGSTKDNDIFVMTKGGAVFDGAANLYVVDSVVKTTYDEDDAYQINFYAEGMNDLYSALFTDESNAVYGNYKTLTKGSVFVANVAEDGFATDYAVIAIMDATNKKFVEAPTFDMNAAIAAAFSNDVSTKFGDGVELVYGYVYDIDKADITIGTHVYDITNGAAQYAYNTNGSKAKIEVGLWDTDNVDEYEADKDASGNELTTGKATLVLLKTFDGEVTDIISITDRKSVTKTAAQTAISETNAPVAGGSSVAEEAEVVEVVEDIVVEDEIIFE